MDRYLDQAQNGPRFLQQEHIATLVMDCLVRGSELGHYQLGAFSIMANPRACIAATADSAEPVLQSLKGYSAYEANRLLGRKGEPFWQRETYDHWVRDRAEWQRIAAYIENNPVKAGLVLRAADYRWSSAHPTWRAKLAAPDIETAPPCVGKNADVARTNACSTSPAQLDL